MIEIAIAAAAFGLSALAYRAVIAARAKRSAARELPPPKPTPTEGLVVGDVVMHPDGELWLAGELELREDGPVARLFHAPGTLDRFVVELADRELALGHATTEVPEGEVPDRLSIEGRHLTMQRRGRGRATATGELPSAIGSGDVRFVLLRGAALILIVVELDNGERLAVIARTFSRSDVDVLPGGKR